MKQEDIILHLGESPDRYLGSVVPPIFQTTLFVKPTETNGIQEEEYVYSRINNPTTEILEKKMAALEQGERALGFASGMAAISAGIMTCIEKDSHVICVDTVYGPTHNFLANYLAKFGVETTFVVGNDSKEIADALRPETSLIYLESPSSHIFRVQDLTAIAEIARKAGVKTMIDNTYATPLFQNPLVLGIDLVAHTASKYIGGHSDAMGGVLIGSEELLEPMVEEERALFGAVMDPHQAWLILRGLRTLPYRIKGHQDNAMAVAQYLEAHPKVKQVFYPAMPSHPDYELAAKQMTGFNGLLSLIIDGTKEQQNQFIQQLRVFQHGVSWGGFESLVADATVNKELPGVPSGVIRLHVGLENQETLIADLEQALMQV